MTIIIKHTKKSGFGLGCFVFSLPVNTPWSHTEQHPGMTPVLGEQSWTGDSPSPHPRRVPGQQTEQKDSQLKGITIRSNKGDSRILDKDPTPLIRLNHVPAHNKLLQSKGGTRAGHCSLRRNKPQNFRGKKKRLVFSFFRLYRKASYSRSCVLVVHPWSPHAHRGWHAKAQLHLNPNFQICPSKFPLFLEETLPTWSLFLGLG